MKKYIFIGLLLIVLSGCTTSVNESRDMVRKDAKDCIKLGGMPVAHYNDFEQHYSEIICIPKEKTK